MSPTIVALVAFLCTFGSALFGMWLCHRLPAHHLDSASKDAINVVVGFVAMMTALVLGLVTASAKSSFDGVDAAVKETAVQALTLDRTLARYGPETMPIRQSFKDTIGARLQAIWPQDSSTAANLDPTHSAAESTGEALADAIRDLQPVGNVQASLQARAMELTDTLLQTRWLVLGGLEHSVPTPFLVILLLWISFIFTSFGLFAPRNGMVLTVLFLCGISVASALFLVLEMDAPFTGWLRVSPDTLRFAYEHLAK